MCTSVVQSAESVEVHDETEPAVHTVVVFAKVLLRQITNHFPTHNHAHDQPPGGWSEHANAGVAMAQAKLQVFDTAVIGAAELDCTQFDGAAQFTGQTRYTQHSKQTVDLAVVQVRCCIPS